ncbi:SIMPL domain-containing protein [Natrinema sp. 1APR25-10V2]|uniref:SIMPL domain-containing protein n=1 Tax=Natrinema sp. 1APR25-10V2 TaxID=2951081 RepID=UPI0028765593|nr:SIMPL domain-containing protein [Natrinema sp. 1APR25-10V2]MDS0473442.1 SIMPL domain-containing protein [Natrinema sp. 1APR25-10V2]
MDRRQFLAASTVGLAATVAGCAGSPLSTADSGSDGNQSAGRGEITVSANGEVEAEPDRAIVSVGVEASGESAEAVTDELATGAEQLRATFDELGIPEENVEEGQYRISPVRRRTGEEAGFEGTHSFEVTLTDVDRVGEVIDAAVAAGADDVGYVNFTLQEETRAELRKDAIDAALANADAEAAHIADNRGVSLEGTTAVTTGGVQVHPVRQEAMASGDAAGDAPPTEIDAEPVSVSASVTVTYAFGE